MPNREDYDSMRDVVDPILCEIEALGKALEDGELTNERASYIGGLICKLSTRAFRTMNNSYRRSPSRSHYHSHYQL